MSRLNKTFHEKAYITTNIVLPCHIGSEKADGLYNEYILIKTSFAPVNIFAF